MGYVPAMLAIGTTHTPPSAKVRRDNTIAIRSGNDEFNMEGVVTEMSSDESCGEMILRIKPAGRISRNSRQNVASYRSDMDALDSIRGSPQAVHPCGDNTHGQWIRRMWLTLAALYAADALSWLARTM